MTEAQHEFVVHQDPAWRDRANFIIHAELPDKDSPKRFEQLWARRVCQVSGSVSVLARALLRRGEFTSPADLADKITSFAIRYNRTAKPWTWSYDAGSDHARYLARHAQHGHSAASEPAIAGAPARAA